MGTFLCLHFNEGVQYTTDAIKGKKQTTLRFPATLFYYLCPIDTLCLLASAISF